ncbi:MAG: hypothetical protein LJE90_07010, partial [Betaproteobacteria bacterium]|nr:hypothetical protein [Betaproteobacteria bacterium]
VHSVSVVIRPLQLIATNNADEARVAALDRAINSLAPTCCEEKEGDAFDVLPILGGKRNMLSVFLQCVGNLPATVTIL